MTMLSIAFSLFLLMDPIGNVPFFISVLKEIDRKRQTLIIFRELVIALIIICFFNFLGGGLMRFLDIQQDTLQIAGGIILFLLCLKMIFPPEEKKDQKLDTEPLIVPLAIPLVAGPGVLAAVMIYATQENNLWVMLGAILIAWCASLLILLSSTWIKSLLGQRGIVAMERLMGLILILISVEMFLNGVSGFVGNLSNHAPL